MRAGIIIPLLILLLIAALLIAVSVGAVRVSPLTAPRLLLQALGAAVQAAAVAGGDDHAAVQARWGLGVGSTAIEPVESDGLRERYAGLRELGR